MQPSSSLLIRNASQVVAVAAHAERFKTGPAMRDPVVLTDTAILVRDGKIDWLGPESHLPPLPHNLQVLDAKGGVVLPGFVDCHTHLVFAGTRTDEFEQRLQGVSYQEIAARGGGISSTVRAVRQASKATLKILARSRLQRLL